MPPVTFFSPEPEVLTSQGCQLKEPTMASKDQSNTSTKRRLDAVAAQLGVEGQGIHSALARLSLSPTSSSPSQHRLLIANRSEIAIRIIRAARKLGGITTIAIYTAQDSPNARFVLEADEAYEVANYMDGLSIVDLAKRVHATAIHPGYGFLSEDVNFAARVVQADIIWVGPSPEHLELFGDKVQAKALARKMGVPVTKGSEVAFADLASFTAWYEGLKPADRWVVGPDVLWEN